MRLLVVFLFLLASAAAQHMAVGFASPNVREHMTYATAKESLLSFEETNFVAVADRILCSLGRAASVDLAIGEIDEKNSLGLEGAENGTVLRAAISFEEMRYAVALLGRYAHQEYVIAFAPQQNAGPSAARLTTLHIPKTTPRSTTERILRISGVLHRTLVDDHTVLAYLPAGTSEEAGVMKAAQRLRARLETESGTGELFGDDDRMRAAAIYDRIIAEYETAHPQHKLSEFLWSREWHDAATRTCTAAP